MKQFHEKDWPVILCSAGDFYGGSDAFNEPKSHFLAKMMGFFGYDAVAVGEMDLNYGLEKLVADDEKYHLNLTCANLIAKNPERGPRPKGRKEPSLQASLGTVFPPYLIVEKEGVKFGFVGLLSPQTKATPSRPAQGAVKAMTYIIEPPAEVAPKVIPEVRKKCDVLILLAHMDAFDLEALLPDYPEIDLVILGHNLRTAPLVEPIDVGGVMVYRATSQGQNIGNLKLTLDGDKHIIDENNRVHFLDANVPDDPDVVAMLDEFDEENKKNQKILYAKQQLKASRGEGAGDIYLGVGTCASCHPAAFEVYKDTKHARAYRTLASQFSHRDANCVGCHVTGYGRRGGFSGLRSLGTPVDLIDVQCEACHGPGANHSRDGSYLKTARESCVKCHTKEDDPDFDFAKDWKKIAH